MSFNGETWEEWDDPLASDGPCPWGGLGNYALADSNCDWKCHFRTACMKIQRAHRMRMQGDIWRQQFPIDRLNQVYHMIIDEVNCHQHFIAAWRRISFHKRCRIENLPDGGMTI
jgi:hypothetical protein